MGNFEVSLLNIFSSWGVVSVSTKHIISCNSLFNLFILRRDRLMLFKWHEHYLQLKELLCHLLAFPPPQFLSICLQVIGQGKWYLKRRTPCNQWNQVTADILSAHRKRVPFMPISVIFMLGCSCKLNCFLPSWRLTSLVRVPVQITLINTKHH